MSDLDVKLRRAARNTLPERCEGSVCRLWRLTLSGSVFLTTDELRDLTGGDNAR